jgi:hypothetical protein
MTPDVLLKKERERERQAAVDNDQCSSDDDYVDDVADESKHSASVSRRLSLESPQPPRQAGRPQQHQAQQPPTGWAHYLIECCLWPAVPWHESIAWVVFCFTAPLLQAAFVLWGASSARSWAGLLETALFASSPDLVPMLVGSLAHAAEVAGSLMRTLAAALGAQGLVPPTTTTTITAAPLLWSDGVAGLHALVVLCWPLWCATQMEFMPPVEQKQHLSPIAGWAMAAKRSLAVGEEHSAAMLRNVWLRALLALCLPCAAVLVLVLFPRAAATVQLWDGVPLAPAPTVLLWLAALVGRWLSLAGLALRISFAVKVRGADTAKWCSPPGKRRASQLWHF